ncbi:hypothetical protein IX51_08280 [uncultured archaeon]|nr:hypothetical protein IX51_08280 [uncultured archaeon]
MGLIATWISGLIGVGLGIGNYLVPVIFASIVVFLVTGAGNIINDIVDVDSDRVNHPGRPLVQGTITMSQARAESVILFAAALILAALFISLYAFIMVIIAEALLVSYEYTLKKRGFVGNVSISIMVGLIFIFGGIAVNSTYKMLILFVMASLANLSREVIKDIEDMKGDTDRVTLPRRYGVRIASAVAVASVLVAVGMSVLPYYLSIFSVYYLGAVAVADALFLLSAYKIGYPHTSQNLSKFAMIVGLISFTIGGLY